jgi:hypothetical protein
MGILRREEFDAAFFQAMLLVSHPGLSNANRRDALDEGCA